MRRWLERLQLIPVLKGEISEVRGEVTRLLAAHDVQRAETEATRAEIGTIRAEIGRLGELVVELARQGAATHQAFASCLGRLDQLEDRAASNDTVLNAVRSEVSPLLGNLADTNEELGKLRLELTRVTTQAELDNEQTAQVARFLTEELMSLKRALEKCGATDPTRAVGGYLPRGVRRRESAAASERGEAPETPSTEGARP